ncbi:MAG TPA: NnrS family protein [Gammaproteobacteria bacterium]|nr:NnrS family protein [Gammaproteobacteria bacterium]
MLKIHDPSALNAGTNALFNLGFRPFFAGAALHAVLVMLAWMGIYVFGMHLLRPKLPAVAWHAHEMIYGYAMAVIAGFLLTAVRNWTGLPTLSGRPLALLFALWALARLLPLLNTGGGLYALAALDLGFVLALLCAVAAPVIRSRQWRQLGVTSKLVLLGLGNAAFYAGLLGWIDGGVRIGIYGGLYLIIALILTMSRRLIPFFTERGVGYPVQLRNRRWLDIASLLLFVLFVVLDVFAGMKQAAAATALALFVLHALRLAGWYTWGIRAYPLLWGLHLAYAFITLGFPLYAASVYYAVSPFLSLHAFAVGGIGLVTLAMMARVSLGHTGRNVHQPPAVVQYALLALVIAAILRVFAPLLYMEHYRLWIACSQTFWILSFGSFLLTYFPMLTKPRIDGQPG